jgi:hypothetical protein
MDLRSPKALGLVVPLYVQQLADDVRKAKVGSEPEALLAFFASLSFAVKRIGLEAGPLSQWLFVEFAAAALVGEVSINLLD